MSRRRLESPAHALMTLTSAELDLLATLVTNSSHVLSRGQLLDMTIESVDPSIDVLINHIRKKFAD